MALYEAYNSRNRRVVKLLRFLFLAWVVFVLAYAISAMVEG